MGSPFAENAATIGRMRNHHAAVTRRLSDPDFQATLVNRWLLPTITGWTMGRAVTGIRVTTSNGQPVGSIRLIARDVAHLLDTAHAYRGRHAELLRVADDLDLLRRGRTALDAVRDDLKPALAWRQFHRPFDQWRLGGRLVFPGDPDRALRQPGRSAPRAHWLSCSFSLGCHLRRFAHRRRRCRWCGTTARCFARKRCA